jgi:hypothetical protein
MLIKHGSAIAIFGARSACAASTRIRNSAYAPYSQEATVTNNRKAPNNYSPTKEHLIPNIK